MLNKILLVITITAVLISNANAGDIYLPSISVSAYKQALKSGENLVFKNAKLPEELRSIALKTLGEGISETTNEDLVISPQIILGSNASRGEYPEFTLLYVESNGKLFPICGATLIDDRKVLTAAHCSNLPNRYFFTPNFYAFSDFTNGIPSSQLFATATKRLHPNFTETSTRIDHDIAVFTLTKSAFTKKAVLYDNPEPLSGAGGEVIGVGLLSSRTEAKPNILQKVSAPIVSNSVCQSAWGFGIQITPTIICAGFRTSDKGSCNGDSGGPLWTTVNGKRFQAGVVSFGPVNCANNSLIYSGYSRISALSSFVRQHAPGAVFSSDIAVNIVPVYQLLLD